MSETVCIGTYASRQEAEFARSLLAEAGIRAMVSADDCGGVRPELAFTTGGAGLFVLSEHAARAAELLPREFEGGPAGPDAGSGSS